MQIHAMSLEMPDVPYHPNRVSFEGVLTLIGVSSDKAPNGARGHRVILTKSAAQEALPSLMGMAISFKGGYDGHDARQKCGIITQGFIDNQNLRVKGYLFARDFPDVYQKLQSSHSLEMSYELADVHVSNMRSSVWELNRATFTGAAILDKDKAAYRNTSFNLVKENKCQEASTKSSSSDRSVKTPRFAQPLQDRWLQCFQWLHRIGQRKKGNGSIQPNGTIS